MNDNVIPMRPVMGASGRPPDPTVRLLRVLRQATRDYMMVLEASIATAANIPALGADATYLMTALNVAVGKRGGGGIGTPIGLERMLTNMLGESEEKTTC